jgi:serine/threonine protein kinase
VASPRTAADFCSLVVRSELLANAVVEQFVERLRAAGTLPPDAAAFADAIVREGLLTQFQAKLLLQGKWKNFFLSGKYKVIEHLGTGGMGAVFLCEHKHMGRRVAIKVLPPDPDDPTHVERYRREAQAIAMLNHPNIVRAFDLDRESGLHLLVMEYIDGPSLQFLVDSRGPLAVPRAVNFIAQAALGLQHAADAGLVHRDVKPSNLMLDRAGTIKLLDLGLARFSRRPDNIAQVSDSKIVLGTADYLAPEQARSSSVDARADVYALGAVAYFFLTGKPPFHGGSVAQKLIRHQMEVPRPVDEVRPEIPAGIAGVIARMLAKNPAERPQSSARVIAELRSWIVHVPPPTPEEMPPSRQIPGQDVDTKARNSTMEMMSRSSRNLLLKTMIATGPPGESH